MSTPSDQELLAYADELLPVEASAAIEQNLREEAALRQRLDQLLQARDQGNLSIGDEWRLHRLSCPSLTELGLFLVRANPPQLDEYIAFHVQTVGCVFCLAQLEEMQASLAADPDDAARQHRRETLYASSAGLLKRRAE
ncbi:MAG: hypothetical protein R3C12_17130 [Planctomycetaceae bacterium]